MITTSVRGHLATYDFPPNFGWSKCDPVALFDAPIESSYRGDLEPLERMLRQLASRCQVVILWLDCDREGEAIGDEVRDVCLKGNPRLNIYRARFSTVLAQEIQRALKSLGVLNENFVAAVQTRSELDLRVGAAFTRFQTLRLQRKFDGFSEQGVVSYGPCQFPTLGFVVERWARIETFIPEDFWYLDLTLRVDAAAIQQQQQEGNNNQNNAGVPPANNNSKAIHFTWKRGRLYDRVPTLVFYESCLEAGEAVVTHLDGRPKNKWRPVPLATVELQKRASRFLRVGSETLMTAADELYQQGYISYPRTETEKFRPEFEHRPLIEQLSGINGDLGQYATKLLTDNHYQNPRAGQHDDQAHPPITPCKAVDPNTIGDQTQRKVYILVVKHYLACCSRDAVGKETQLTVKMASEEFNARGLMILEKNWLEIYHPWERWSTGQGELPPLQVGSRIAPSSLLMKDGRTAAPLPITEVELISLMDRNGIGTDATIAQHISTIQNREYATKDANQRFLPTKLGIALVEGYNSMGYQLNKPDLRRETEAECNLVAAGRKPKNEVVTAMLAKMRQCYATASQEAQKLDEAVARHFPRLGASNDISQVVQAQFSECGVCHNQMALKQERNARGNDRNAVRRKLVYCSTCRAGWNLPRGNIRPKTQDENGGPAVKCPICAYQVIQILRGEGYTGNGYHVCPRCFSDPPAEHGGAANGGEFKCFKCQHPTCSLAGGKPGDDVEVFLCPFCNRGGARPENNMGKVMAKKNSRGFVLSCNKYAPGQDSCPYTIWLPKECESVSIPSGDENQDGICTNCSTGPNVVRKVKFVWKRGSLPAHLGRGATTCVLCDANFRRELQISLPQPNQVASRPIPQRGGRGGGGRGGGGRGGAGGGRGGRAPGGRGRGGGRGREGRGGNQQPAGIVCYSCNEPGHFANNCPNR
jgi:DNA topoisomerase-3